MAWTLRHLTVARVAQKLLPQGGNDAPESMDDMRLVISPSAAL